MRYQGQNYEQEVAIPDGAMDDAALAAVYAEYGRLYESFYGYRLDGIPIEVVRALGRRRRRAAVVPAPARSAGAARRPRPGHGRSTSPRRASWRLGSCGARSSGTEMRSRAPRSSSSMDSTVVVPPGWALAVLADGILEVTRG